MPTDILRFVHPEDVLHKRGLISTEEAGILDDINRKLAGVESFDAVMDLVFEQTKDIFPCDRIGVAFLEDKGRRVVARAIRARYDSFTLCAGYAEGLAGSTLRHIIETGCLRVIGDLRAYLELNPKSRSTAAIVNEGQVSNLTCPLVVEGRPVGFLFRSSRTAFAYTDREVLLHLQMAERLSQSVEKAWRIAQLSAANQGYTEMLAFASHELKGPLATMIMECDMLLEGYAGPLSGRQEEAIRRMRGKVKTLVETTHDYLDLARYEGGQLSISILEGVDPVADIILPVLDILDPEIQAREVRIEIDAPPGMPPVSCDPRALQTVVHNLARNALKYGNEGGLIRIALRHDGTSFTGSVWNTGTGFPPEEHGKLFKRFSRLFVPEFLKVSGTGVGLYIEWQLVDLDNGSVSASSEYGRNAEFTFTIPQPVDGER